MLEKKIHIHVSILLLMGLACVIIGMFLQHVTRKPQLIEVTVEWKEVTFEDPLVVRVALPVDKGHVPKLFDVLSLQNQASSGACTLQGNANLFYYYFPEDKDMREVLVVDYAGDGSSCEKGTILWSDGPLNRLIYQHRRPEVPEPATTKKEG